MPEQKKKRVLVSPLDWGLGHATRCVPVIKALLAAGAEVLLAADGRPAHFLRNEFPALELLSLPGYNITYPKNGNMVLHFALAAPGILKNIKRENGILQEIIEEKKIDIVISDNRFGLSSPKAKSVYITHQLRIKAPAGEHFVNRLHHRYMKRFDEIWVPDIEGPESFSGELGQNNPGFGNLHYIGPLTRFHTYDRAIPAEVYDFDHELLVVLSGPEPQRTLLEELLLKQLASLKKKTLLVRGITEKNDYQKLSAELTIINNMHGHSMEYAFRSAKAVICRSGYSTLCDLGAMKKKAIVIPTPGQSEQEYLAAYHAGQNRVVMQAQNKLNLAEGLNALEKTSGMNLYVKQVPPEDDRLKKRIDALLC